MKVALLGGAFNPPHHGHLMIARQVLDFAGMDAVWFLPNYGQIPAKADMAPVESRLAMTRLLKLTGTSVSTIEIDNTLDGQTINLLPFLPKEHSFSFIVGADQLPFFHQWGRWEELLKRMPFLVFPRNGYPNEPLYENMQVVRHELLITTDISSTKIRKRVARGLPIEQFVPKGVAKYIATHKLYK